MMFSVFLLYVKAIVYFWYSTCIFQGCVNNFGVCLVSFVWNSFLSGFFSSWCLCILTLQKINSVTYRTF